MVYFKRKDICQPETKQMPSYLVNMVTAWQNWKFIPFIINLDIILFVLEHCLSSHFLRRFFLIELFSKNS
jgi:hypothetical protein